MPLTCNQTVPGLSDLFLDHICLQYPKPRTQIPAVFQLPGLATVRGSKPLLLKWFHEHLVQHLHIGA